MVHVRWRSCLAALAAGFAGGCSLLGESQVDTLDLAKLEPDQGYVVGTIHTSRIHDDGRLVTVDEHPDVTADLDVCERTQTGTLTNALTLGEGGLEEPEVWTVIVHGQASPALFALKLPAHRCCLAALRIPLADGEWSAPIGWCFDVVPGAVTYVGDVQLKLTAEGDRSLHWKSLDAHVRADRPLVEKLLRERFPKEQPQLLDGVTGNTGD
ncbi:MAG TPA: hypothetical protein VFY71_18140 [Planctomycetota bacterium]|nr:hypothetical protein [Planctomycetota bacterium]